MEYTKKYTKVLPSPNNQSTYYIDNHYLNKHNRFKMYEFSRTDISNNLLRPDKLYKFITNTIMPTTVLADIILDYVYNTSVIGINDVFSKFNNNFEIELIRKYLLFLINGHINSSNFKYLCYSPELNHIYIRFKLNIVYIFNTQKQFIMLNRGQELIEYLSSIKKSTYKIDFNYNDFDELKLI